MELLIPGLALVALMVYASTRIKKRAAEAFRPETVRTDDFTFEKPEGFLHVAQSDRHLLEAYSKEFGEGNHASIRKARIEIDIAPDQADLVPEGPLERIGPDAEILRANEMPQTAFYRIVASDRGNYRLRAAVLTEHAGEYEARLIEALRSFHPTT